jgi:hypothetical protein
MYIYIYKVNVYVITVIFCFLISSIHVSSMGKSFFFFFQQIKKSEERILSAQNGVGSNLKSVFCNCVISDLHLVSNQYVDKRVIRDMTLCRRNVSVKVTISLL